jgi:hypothetical protein
MTTQALQFVALSDVLPLKTRIGAQRPAMEALADDAEDLNRRDGV